MQIKTRTGLKTAYQRHFQLYVSHEWSHIDSAISACFYQWHRIIECFGLKGTLKGRLAQSPFVCIIDEDIKQY